MIVYFDNSATTKVCPEAAEAVQAAMLDFYGNPSSTHALGREAKARLGGARAEVAAALGARPEEIFFTSGGTEADNWALCGAAELTRHWGKHLITTAVEHDAILKTAARLSQKGWDVTYLEPDSVTGRVSPADVEKALREDTALVSVMLVNNETGAVNPIADIADVIRRKKSEALLHTDAVQGFCKIPFTPKALGADLVSISSHKIHGPKGCGALFVRKGLRLPPIITGGGQEGGFRSGTEAMPAIMGFAAAAKRGKARLSEDASHMKKLREHTIGLLRQRLPEVLVIGAGDAPHILSISLPGYGSEVLMNCLDGDGICVSKSSACKKGGRSHVLEAMKLPYPVIDGAIRISFCGENTMEETEYFVSSLERAAGRLRKKK